MNSADNFTLYIKNKSLERAHFQITLGFLYLQVYLYLLGLQWNRYV